jgi:hypothetical protein
MRQEKSFLVLFFKKEPLALYLVRGSNPTAEQGVIDEQDHDRANHSYKHAVDIEAGNRRGAERGKQPAADEGADNAEDDIQQNTGTGVIDDFARDETSDEAEDKPGENGHETLLKEWLYFSETIHPAMQLRARVRRNYQVNVRTLP